MNGAHSFTEASDCHHDEALPPCAQQPGGKLGLMDRLKADTHTSPAGEHREASRMHTLTVDVAPFAPSAGVA